MADNSSPTFSIGGESWTLELLNQGMKTQYSTWVTSRAREAAIDTEMALQRRARKIRQQLVDDSRATALGGEASISELQREELEADMGYLMETAARQLKEFNDARTTGKLHFTGEICIETMRSTEGTVKMMQLVTARNHSGKGLDELTEIYKKNQNAWVDAVREVAGLGKKSAIPTTSEEKSDGEIP